MKEMRRVSNGLADEEYCHKLCKEAPITAKYLEEHGVKFVHHDEPNVAMRASRKCSDNGSWSPSIWLVLCSIFVMIAKAQSGTLARCSRNTLSPSSH